MIYRTDFLANWHLCHKLLVREESKKNVASKNLSDYILMTVIDSHWIQCENEMVAINNVVKLSISRPGSDKVCDFSVSPSDFGFTTVRDVYAFLNESYYDPVYKILTFEASRDTVIEFAVPDELFAKMDAALPRI